MTQSYRHFEIIIVDDGSSDGTRQWIEKHPFPADNLLIYVYQKNSGPYSARNNGLSHAKGKYIAFQDSDDEWPDYHLAELCHILEENNDIDWIFGSIQRIDHDTREVVEMSNFVTESGNTHPFIKLKTEQRKNGVQVIVDRHAGSTAISYQVPGSTQCGLIRASVFSQIKFDPSYRTAYDRFFAIKCLLLGYKFAYVNKTHQIYHIHDSHISLVNGANAEKLYHSSLTMIRGYRSLNVLSLTDEEQVALSRRIAQAYAWELSVAYILLKRHGKALLAALCAVRNDPTHWRYYKLALGCLIKWLIRW
jgi:glycosyltransferase involved in cell wall biosynthesis